MDNHEAIPVATVRRHLAEVGGQIEKLFGQIEKLGGQLAKLEAQRAGLEIKQTTLGALLDDAVPSEETRAPQIQGRRRLSPQRAVLELVSTEPGIKRPELVDRLQGSVKSEAINIRSTLSATITNLKSHGLIEEDADRRLTLRRREVPSNSLLAE